MHYQIKASSLSGTIAIPPSKSHTLRAILFASLATGKSIIHHYLHSPDTTAMIHACKLLGAEISVEQTQLTIIGTNGKPKTPENIIDAGNSGQVLRFIAAVTALTANYAIITGDQSVRNNRPIQPLLDALSQLNVFAVSANQDGSAPIIIKGPFHGGETTLTGEDSQPVSGLLIAAAFAKSPTVIHVKNPGEKPWIDLTLDWFKRLGIHYQQENYTYYQLAGNTVYSGFEYTVPGDFSSAAFPIVAALITRSEIMLTNLDMHDVQGDKILISLLQEIGALIDFDQHEKKLHIKKSADFIAKEININHCIDAVPILAVLSCFMKGKTIITGAAIARTKESDRLAAITQELTKMGANIAEFADGLIIKPAKLYGAKVHSHHDHRIAMALAVAGLSAVGETEIDHTACIDKSYPHFVKDFKKLGAAMEVCL